MKNQKLGYFSSYDRGLEILLDLWPRILEKYPKTTLDCCYGWDLFIKGYRNNPERMEWMEKINKKMEQKGITHHGRVGKEELHKIRKECGIWAYPTSFQEINCITALECQRDGLVPVTINDFALKETVGSGKKIDGSIYSKNVKEQWLEALFYYMGDRKAWIKESKKAREFARGYSWDVIYDKWLKVFKEE